MFHRILKAYKEEGFEMHIGNNFCLCAALTKDGNFAHTGGGISLTDIAFFFGLQRIHDAKRILCIGNASGYGTLCVAEIFSNALIDVMDAEIEGDFNTKGSELTKKFSEKYYSNRITFTHGFCPKDLGVFVGKTYDLIFMDGLHTDEQQLLDVAGLLPYAAEGCIIYLHDVMLLQMEKSWEHIKHNTSGFTGYNVDFTAFGCKVLVRGLPEAEEWLKMIDHSPMAEFANPVATLRASVVSQPAQADQNSVLEEKSEVSKDERA